MELFTFLQMGGVVDRVVVRPIQGSRGLKTLFANFQAENAMCYKMEDRQKVPPPPFHGIGRAFGALRTPTPFRTPAPSLPHPSSHPSLRMIGCWLRPTPPRRQLLGIIESSFGSFNTFNRVVRSLFNARRSMATRFSRFSSNAADRVNRLSRMASSTILTTESSTKVTEDDVATV